MNSFSRPTLVTIGWLATVLLTLSSAHGQTAASTTAAPNTAATPPVSGEEVVVTATRRAEALIDVPAAVTAFTAADIESRGIDQPADFLNITPGVFFFNNTTPGTSFINIRGVTQSRNAESPVGIIIDGVFQNNPLSFNNELYDVQQLEVLKGPQGALYGRNASAGAIIITTNQPSTEYQGYLDASFGRHNTYKAEAGFGGPLIGDTLLFRIAGYETGTEGFLKNTFLSSQGNTVYADHDSNAGGRARLLWNVTDNGKVDFRFTRTQENDGFNNDIFDPLNSSYAGILDTLSYDPIVRNFSHRSTQDESVKVDWQFPGIGTLTSISAHDTLDEQAGGESLPYLPTIADGTQWLVNRYETASQELRLQSPEEQRFRWLGGFYFEHTRRLFASSSGTNTGASIVVIDPSGATTGPGTVNPASGGITATAVNQNAGALFASVGFDITSSLDLTAAYRYDKDREGASNQGPYNAAFVPNPQFGDRRYLRFSKGQPKVTLRYKSDIGNFYATYAEGFKTGGFNPEGSRAAALRIDPQTPIQDSFNAENTKSYEIGYKGEFFERRFSANLAAYYNDIKGANYFDFLVAAANQLNLNIDDVHAYGVEAELVGKVTQNFTVAASVSGIHNRIQSDRFDPLANGKVSPYFPDITVGVTANYQQPITEQLQGFLRADYQHVGRLYWDLEEQVKRPPQDFVDLRAGVTMNETKPLRIELFCRNCTNKTYINEAIFLAELKITVAFPAIDTRVYGLEVVKHF